MKRHDQILAHFDREVRMKEALLASAYQSQPGTGVKRAVGPFASESHNWIDYHNFDIADANTIIDEQIAVYDSIGHAFRWKVYTHDSPAELPAKLLERGFRKTNTYALMTIESKACEGMCPEGVEYKKITDPESLASELQPVSELVWDHGSDELVDAWAMEHRDMGDHIGIYVAKENARTVCCGLVRYDRDFQFGGLFAGTTVPSARRRGLYRGLVHVRAEDALARGANFLYTEAGPMSRPILERIGFAEVTTVTNYIWDNRNENIE